MTRKNILFAILGIISIFLVVNIVKQHSNGEAKSRHESSRSSQKKKKHNNSEPRAEVLECVICHTDGRCRICGGLGYTVPMYGYSKGMRVSCDPCLGSGQCKYCHGKGYMFAQFTREGVYVDGVLYTPSEAREDREERIRERKGDGFCSKCGNTGIDPNPSSGGDLRKWVAIYHNSDSRCVYCNKFEEHWHTRCPRCNIPT